MNITELIFNVVECINRYFTDYVIVLLLIGVGVFFTLKTRFVQVRCLPSGFKSVFGGIFGSKKEKDGVTPFAALATAVGSQVGIGNIVGVAVAISIGGAGAVFWMWVSAFLGMATVYAEAVAAQITRKKGANGYYGGPAYYIKAAIKGRSGKLFSGIFAVSAVFALGCAGVMIQSNAIAVTVSENYGISRLAVGLLLSVACFVTFKGGMTKIASISEKLVVIMAIGFIGICTALLFINREAVGGAVTSIFSSAFSPDAVNGYGASEAFRLMIGQGIKKGLFSNEAGLGTTPHIHAAANAKAPHSQGVMAMMGVFIDSFVIMTLSALVILTVWGESGDSVDMKNIMLFALKENLGENIGKGFLSLSLILFGYSSIISWNCFGGVNFEYVFGKKSIWIYIVFSSLFVLLGSVFQSEFVWSVADLFNGFMIVPNVIALFWLSKYIK